MMHECPLVSGIIPHVGGPIIGPGAPTVLVSGLPMAKVGDECVCVGPPDSIVVGSSSVLVEGMPAAYLGSTTAHGGTVVLGIPTVMVAP